MRRTHHKNGKPNAEGRRLRFATEDVLVCVRRLMSLGEAYGIDPYYILVDLESAVRLEWAKCLAQRRQRERDAATVPTIGGTK